MDYFRCKENTSPDQFVPKEVSQIEKLPDEVIEEIMAYLSFSDLFNLSKEGLRLEVCAMRVLKKKKFEIAIFPGSIGGYIDFGDVVEIAIVNDSITHINPSIPSVPSYMPELAFFSVTQLPNGDVLLAGGYTTVIPPGYTTIREPGVVSNEYLHYRKGSNQWEKVATMKIARYGHASVLIDGHLLTTGGINWDNGTHGYKSDLEKFSFESGVKEMKKMPIALKSHTATMFGNNKMLICGGETSESRIRSVLSQRTFIYDVKRNSWTEGPSLLTPRSYHSSCAIQSDDGSKKSIIVIGGKIQEGKDKNWTNTTELLDLNVQKWVQGPSLPCGYTRYVTCVTLPQTSNFSCVVLGKGTSQEKSGIGAYGLDKRLMEWKFLGKISAHSGRYA